MTWLEDERAQRERLDNSVAALGEEMRSGFAGVNARFDLVFAQMNVALEQQRTAFEKQHTVFATAIEKQNTAIEKQNTAIGKQNTSIERALKEQTRFYFLAWAVQLAAIIGLYAR